MLQPNIGAFSAISVPPNAIKVEPLINIENLPCLSSTGEEPLGFLHTRMAVLNLSYNLWSWHRLLWGALLWSLIPTDLIIFNCFAATTEIEDRPKIHKQFQLIFYDTEKQQDPSKQHFQRFDASNRHSTHTNEANRR